MISKDKTYRTRGGQEVRIYATDGAGYWPIHGAVKLDDRWLIREWTKHGISTLQEQCVTDFDLIEVKPRIKRTVWLNVYPKGHVLLGFDTAKEAYQNATPNRLACVKVEIDCEEGEGL